ncbi:hypothetical protein EW146_g2044 [Bondarzewia mesenterica]|uniref:SURF1-like protein n=1 Tax=Bondarzewia mesenterica TaxID=1095465 RepID=A0A4V3XFV8_9AGAM|nr:hypothetical protein EW146_g2044 [Bondarzewia mesenterica]
MIVLGVIPIFTFYLGTWQLQRLKWKVSLIDELTEKLERESLHLPNKVKYVLSSLVSRNGIYILASIAAIPDFIYRKVILRGRWDDARSMLLGPRVRDGTNGYHLITPLIRTNASTVLVDRGFVSGDFVKSGKRIPIVEGEVEVRGMLRDSQARNYFTPDNHPEKGEWYWADLNAMAEYAGGENANVQQVLVEEIFGKAAVVDVRNAHASYVVTWYALSAFTTVMFCAHQLSIGQRLRVALQFMPRTIDFSPSQNLASTDASRPPHIHFPTGENDVNRPGSSASTAEAIGKPLGRPSTFQRSSSSHDVIPFIDARTNGRRRVRSAHAASVLGVPSQTATIPASSNPRRRTAAAIVTTRGLTKMNRAQAGSSLESPSEEFGPGVFSDEYDLYPHILEDVERALKLKARREARLKATVANSHLREVSSKSDMASASSGSSPIRTARPLVPPPPSITPRLNGPSLESEIDFSPSVGVEKVDLHPIPLSSNDGATLDWGGSPSEDEKPDKRWSLSRTMRKSKDKGISNSSKDVVEKQESLYVDKLARIRQGVKPHTLKKAEITRQQLQRRYNLLSSSIGSSSNALTPTKVVRWFSSLDPPLQSDLDRAEPLTWLKHLRDRSGAKADNRLPWHLSALIIEEFIRSLSRRETMETIPEDTLATGSSSLASYSPPEKSPSNASSFDSPSRAHLGASLSRRRSTDGHVSFEPVVEPGRRSSADDPRRSAEGFTRIWRQSLSGAGSPRSSVYSMLSASNTSHNASGMSPASSRRHLRDIVRRVGLRGTESDDASASSQHSLSEGYIRSDEGGAKRRKLRPRSRPPELESVSPVPIRERNTDLHDDAQMDMVEVSRPLDADDPTTAKPEMQSDPLPSRPSAPVMLHRSRYRTSLPPSERTSLREEEQGFDEDAEHQEYERRARLLDDAVAQNQRNRGLLQRIATGVKEYDVVQSRMSKIFGLSFVPLSPELLDAFSHDPAVVTGSTRFYRGWRAVESIHEHIQRQQETVQTFLQQAEARGHLPPQPNILDKPLAALSRALDDLEGHRAAITEQSEKVAQALARVKELHSTVKTEYNDTAAHTSSVYPELSYIVALEESYKDHYQQVWEFGMDALTFLLDTVTPFWRNYGKVIGIDVQDFLIIPWYRNEFTGEAKRYPIKALPKRSLRHWIALVFFFFVSLSALLSLTRMASASASFCRLPFIVDMGLRWMALPVFSIVVVSLYCTVAVVACIVAAQLAVVTWWLFWWAKILD